MSEPIHVRVSDEERERVAGELRERFARAGSTPTSSRSSSSTRGAARRPGLSSSSEGARLWSDRRTRSSGSPPSWQRQRDARRDHRRPGRRFHRQPRGAVIRRLDHVAVVVTDTEAALLHFRDVLGLEVVLVDTPPEVPVKLTYLDLGNTWLQLVEPLDPNHSLPRRRPTARRSDRVHYVPRDGRHCRCRRLA